jgi:hypothetical protein
MRERAERISHDTTRTEGSVECLAPAVLAPLRRHGGARVRKDGHYHADVARQNRRQRTDDKRERGEEAGVDVPRGRGIGARMRHEEQDHHCKHCHEDEADLVLGPEEGTRTSLIVSYTL